MWRSDSWATWVSPWGAPGLGPAPHAGQLKLLLQSRRPLIQELLLPSTAHAPPTPSCTYAPTGLGCPMGAPPWGPGTPCGSSHRHQGSLKAHNAHHHRILYKTPQTIPKLLACSLNLPRPDGLFSALPGVPSAGTTCQLPHPRQGTETLPHGQASSGPQEAATRGQRLRHHGRPSCSLVPSQAGHCVLPSCLAMCSVGVGR